MSGGLERARAHDAAGVRLRHPTGARAGMKVKGLWRIRGWAPVIVRAGVQMDDIHRERVLPGNLLKTWKKDLDRLLREGKIREIIQGPELLFSDAAANRVVNEGLDYLLDVALSAGSQITAWYVGLTDDTPGPAAGDTLASHGGWTEFTEYSEGARQGWTDGGVSGQSVDNSGSPAAFSCNNDTNGGLGGAFLCSAATGTSGTLYSAVALTGGNKVVGNGTSIDATYTLTMADDGA